VELAGEHNEANEELTFFIITSYAEIRSEATKSRVRSSTSYKSLTFPSAIFGSPSMEVESKIVSAIVRSINRSEKRLNSLKDTLIRNSNSIGSVHPICEI
jgi:hypothetical protein